MNRHDVKISNPYETGYEISGRIKVLESFNKMADGFFELLGIRDDWWEWCSFSTFESEMISSLWKEIDPDKLMDNFSKIQIVLMGSYCDPKRFLESLKLLKDEGVGVYHLNDTKELQ